MGSGVSASYSGATPEPARGSRFQAKHVLFGAIALMYVYVLGTSESFLFDSKDPEWKHIESFKWWLLPHGLAAGLALFLGPMQFSDRLRRRFTKMHRVMGRLYVLGVLVGAPLGVYIQHFEEKMGGPRSFTVATVADAGIWMLATAVAMVFIFRGKTQLHRQWMTRSFACALIFIEVRVVQGLTGWAVFTEAIVWTCVAAAFPLADLVLHWQDLRKRNPLKARAAAF